jgi:hypothetical protein
MSIAITLIILGLLTQVLVLLPQIQQACFSKVCEICGYQIPPMERPPALHNCPECDRRRHLSDSLPQQKA